MSNPLTQLNIDHNRLIELLDEGLNSGDPVPVDAAFWQRIRDEVHQCRRDPSAATELDSVEP